MNKLYLSKQKQKKLLLTLVGEGAYGEFFLGIFQAITNHVQCTEQYIFTMPNDQIDVSN